MLYADLPVDDFRPAALKTIRQEMVDSGLCRRITNQRVGFIKQIFAWGVGEELVDESTAARLKYVENLQAGMTPAVDYAPIPPVSMETVAKTLPFMPASGAGRHDPRADVRRNATAGNSRNVYSGQRIDSGGIPVFAGRRGQVYRNGKAIEPQDAGSAVAGRPLGGASDGQAGRKVRDRLLSHGHSPGVQAGGRCEMVAEPVAAHLGDIRGKRVRPGGGPNHFGPQERGHDDDLHRTRQRQRQGNRTKNRIITLH